MKKLVLTAAVALGALTASAQAVEQPSFFDNWSVGVVGGVTTPLKNAAFFKDMRATVGMNINKQITPTFGVGVESLFGINTSRWPGRVHSTTAFDNSYVGLYGSVDLFNLFGGWQGKQRPFTMAAVAGAGWGHYFVNSNGHKDLRPDHNFFATKAGLRFNFNVSDNVTINVEPSVMWNMTDGNWSRTSAAYDKTNATFQMTAGLTYRFGGVSFDVVEPFNQAEFDALNAQVNSLRADLEACVAASAITNAAWEAKCTGLQNELVNCLNRPTESVTPEVTNQYNSVRFVFFRIGSSTVTADQQPNVEMIADYMKSHPDATCVIKGYASADGNYDFNVKLAAKRAEAVKTMLVNKYKIAADRIKAEGEGVGHMFTEESWNRVSICTLEETE